MSYSSFTFEDLKTKYNLSTKDINLFAKVDIPEVEVSQRLQEDLEEAKNFSLVNEKIKSEAIIFPILKELRRTNTNISIFSGYTLNIENDKDLNGNPDFMISAMGEILEPQNPIFCLAEAKNGIIEEGYAQCAAEMYAARLFNQNKGQDIKTIYGAVSNAFDWVFLKLENDTIFIDKERYFLNQISTILGIMQFIIDQYSN